MCPGFGPSRAHEVDPGRDGPAIETQTVPGRDHGHPRATLGQRDDLSALQIEYREPALDLAGLGPGETYMKRLPHAQRRGPDPEPRGAAHRQPRASQLEFLSKAV